MRKIIFLCGCILTVLLLCFLDGGRQKEKRMQDAWMVNAVVQEETETETETKAAESEQKKIRVLIKTAGYASCYHDEIEVTSDMTFTISDGNSKTKYEPQKTVKITAEDPLFQESDILYLKSEGDSFVIEYLQRDKTRAEYPGKLEIHKTEEGLLLINELPLEEYLCGVVPSEMPSSYPEEALKAQAVCARTYAIRQMQEGRAQKYFADVDDSVSYQVYNNQDRTAATDQAVYDTENLVLKEGENLIEALYYSTSCGRNTKLDLSAEAVFASFLTDDTLAAYEAGEPWFRWESTLSLSEMPGVVSMEVTERRPDGAAQVLQVKLTEGAQKTIEGEYEIRRYLAQFEPAVTLQNGEEKEGLTLLPSAFLILQPQYEEESLTGYTILGGGYGHGNGMSQNGAKQMALQGMTFEEILKAYYEPAAVEKITETDLK